ncbi:hypothetical protein D3C75_1193960 [compost metagenome]
MPSTRISLTPLQEPDLLMTLMSYLQPRKRRLAVNPSQSEGMQGSMRRPSKPALMPMMYWVAATYIQAAVPDSQDTLARPNLSDSGPNRLEA